MFNSEIAIDSILFECESQVMVATGLFSFNIASGMSVSLTLLRSKFKFISATSSSTCLLKRLNMQCSFGFVEDCTNMCMNHCVAQDELNYNPHIS